jgi:hypothetical protein
VAHEIATAEAQAITRAQYAETKTNLYEHQALPPHLFQKPLADLLSLPTTRLFNWLQSHEASTLYHIHTQQPPLNYQENPE